MRFRDDARLDTGQVQDRRGMPGGKGLALEMPTRETGPYFEKGKRVWASWDRDQGFFL